MTSGCSYFVQWGECPLVVGVRRSRFDLLVSRLGVAGAISRWLSE